MKLAFLFGAFLIGLLSNEPCQSLTAPIWELATLSILIATLLRVSDSRLSFFIACFTSFVLGLTWIRLTPTWPPPFKWTNSPNKVTITGRTLSETVSSPLGPLLPLSVKSVEMEPPSTSSSEPEKGAILVLCPHHVNVVPGALYRVSGAPISDSSAIYSPIALRYKPRGIIKANEEPKELEGPSGLQALINHLRYRLLSHLTWGCSSNEEELVASITFGQRACRLDREKVEVFRKAGISHLIVASGAQLSILFFPFLLITRKVRIKFLAKLCILGLIGTTILIFARLLGGDPSILRASAMAYILLVSFMLKKDSFGIASLSFAGFYWLLQNPLLSRDTGFLLSFGASFGIVAFSRPIMNLWDEKPRPPSHKKATLSVQITERLAIFIRFLLRAILHCIGITASAQLGVAPVLASTMGQISLGGFFANLFAVPLGEGILVLGAVSAITGFISPVLSLHLNALSSPFAKALIIVGEDFSRIPCSTLTIHPLPGWFTAIYYASLLTFIGKPKTRRKVLKGRKTICSTSQK